MHECPACLPRDLTEQQLNLRQAMLGTHDQALKNQWAKSTQASYRSHMKKMENFFTQHLGYTYLDWLPIKQPVSRKIITQYMQFRKLGGAKRHQV